MKSFGMMLVLFVLVIVALSANLAFAAGGSIGGTSNLGGLFEMDGVTMQSNANTNGTWVNGSFYLSLDADQFSLEYANWYFYTDKNDTSRWTATCGLHGKRNSHEDYQRQYWSQSYSGDVVNMSASLDLDCHSKYGPHIQSLQSEIASLQDYLNSNPNADNAQEIKTQILLLQIQVLTWELKNEDVLYVSGNFGVGPSELESSTFNWRNTTDKEYLYPNGYDQPPVITELPSWSAEYRMYGEFIAPTPAEADAMGAEFAQTQDVPEPSCFVLMIGAVAVATLRRRRHAIRG